MEETLADSAAPCAVTRSWQGDPSRLIRFRSNQSVAIRAGELEFRGGQHAYQLGWSLGAHWGDLAELPSMAHPSKLATGEEQWRCR